MAVVPWNKLQAQHLDPDSLGIDAVNPGCRTIWSPEGTWPDLPTFLAPVCGNVWKRNQLFSPKTEYLKYL